MAGHVNEADVVGVPPGRRGLLFALVAAPTAWFIHLLAGYAITSLACGQASARAAIHIISAVFLLIALAGVLVAWRQWQTLRGDAAGTIENTRGRDAFLAVAGLLLSALFAAIIVLAWAALLALGGCL